MNTNFEIIATQTPGVVTFENFEEVKETLRIGLQDFKGNVYTVEHMDVAESDRKILRDIKKKLDDKKKELKKAYSMPYEEVEQKINELIDMVKEPLDIIDSFIKENEKAIKEKEIMSYARATASSALSEHAEKIIKSEEFFNPKWLNKTYSMKQWKEDVDKIISNAVSDINTINSIGGESRQIMLAHYYDRLSMDGMKDFISAATSDTKTQMLDETDDGDAVVGYKVLKISATQRQMRQILTQLEMMDVDVEELEDGMPQDMEEIKEADFDSFVCFDIEHTGTFGIANGDAEAEIIEIGAVKVVNGQIVEQFDELANPGRKIVPRIARLTNITDDMVADKPSVDEIIGKFKTFVGDNILVGHNIKSCDIPHITRAAKRAGIIFDNKYFDTNVLARRMKKDMGWENTKLTYLSEYFNIEQLEAHRAWCDAQANAEVYLKMKDL